jgi:hypothetical protein
MNTQKLTATTSSPDGIYILSDSILVIDRGVLVSETSKARLVIVTMSYTHLGVFDRENASVNQNNFSAKLAGYGHNNPNRI